MDDARIIEKIHIRAKEIRLKQMRDRALILCALGAVMFVAIVVLNIIFPGYLAGHKAFMRTIYVLAVLGSVCLGMGLKILVRYLGDYDRKHPNEKTMKISFLNDEALLAAAGGKGREFEEKEEKNE